MEATRYKVRWIVNAVRLGKRGKRSINLGFCEKDKKVAFISILGVENVHEFVKPFIVVDVYVNKECEDGRYCWNLECPYNRATLGTLKKYIGKKCDSKTFNTISDRLQEFGQYFISKIDWNEEGQIIYDKAPLVLSFKRRQKQNETFA